LPHLLHTKDILNITTTIAASTTTPLNAESSVSFKCNNYSNINFEGSDLMQFEADSIEECCVKCGATPTCRTFTYLTDANYCMLKSDIPKPHQIASTSNTVSGLLL